MTENGLPDVWSCGGGTQSAAIAALIVQGKLPKPDYAVMVDTGKEKSATWRYVDGVLVPALATVGVTLEIVKTADYATVGEWGGKDGNSLLLPAFSTAAGSTTAGGAAGKMTNFCSHEWKSRPLSRYLKARHGLKRWRVWMGISTEEMRRMRARDSEGNPRYHPLIETIPMRRGDCVQLVTEAMGWPDPPRSSCWYCPNQSAAQWRALRDEDPADFAKAVEADAAFRRIDPHVYLHPSAVPLSMVDFDAQGELNFGGPESCDSGFCFV